MKRVSRGRQIWRQLFLRNIGITIPYPFFLSKPLNDCSADDIEADLRRWESGWGSQSRQPKIDKCPVGRDQSVKEPPVSLQSTCLLPGGRWLIVGYEDGSVWSFDLLKQDKPCGKVTRKLLIPSPFEGTEHDGSPIQVQLSIDFSSHEALGDSQDTYTLQQLNIAVVACPKMYRTASTRITVWRVHLSGGLDGAESELCLGQQLSSFTEIWTAALKDCSLLGPALAYSMGLSPAKCVVVVRWSEAHGKSKDSLERQYLPQLALDVGGHFVEPSPILTKPRS